MTAVELEGASALPGADGTGKGDAALDRFLADLCRALAAAEAGEEGVGGQAGAQTPADGDEEFVASDVAETVVDHLEAVQVEEEHGRRSTPLTGGGG